jgi:hypothetical protein
MTDTCPEIAQRQADVARLGAWGALVDWATRPNAHPGDVLALKMLGEESETWRRHWPSPDGRAEADAGEGVSG